MKYYLNNKAIHKVNILWTPYSLGSNLALWLDATDTDTITLNGSNVSQWDDKSDNQFDVTQDNGGIQPQWIDGNSSYQINSRPTVVWNDPLQYLSNSAIIDMPLSIFMVCQLDNLTATVTLFDCINDLNERVFSRYSDSTNILQWVTRGVDEGDGELEGVNFSSVLLSSNPQLLNFENQGYGSTSNFFKNGSLFGSVALGQERLNNLILGNSSSLSQAWLGRMGEIIMFSGVPSQEQRQTIEGYLAHKWDLTSILPVGHPYISAAP